MKRTFYHNAHKFQFLNSKDGHESMRKPGLKTVYKCNELRNMGNNQLSHENASQVSKGTFASTVNMGESQTRVNSRGNRMGRGAKSAHRIQQSVGIFSSDTVINTSEEGKIA